jgi:hypothetical protein
MVEFLVCVSRCIVTRALGVSKARSPSAFQWQWHPLVRENTNNKRLTLLYSAGRAKESDRSWAAYIEVYIYYMRWLSCVCVVRSRSNDRWTWDYLAGNIHPSSNKPAAVSIRTSVCCTPIAAKGICWCIDRVTTRSLLWCVGCRGLLAGQNRDLPPPATARDYIFSRQLCEATSHRPSSERSNVAYYSSVDWTPPVSRIVISPSGAPANSRDVYEGRTPGVYRLGSAAASLFRAISDCQSHTLDCAFAFPLTPLTRCLFSCSTMIRI